VIAMTNTYKAISDLGKHYYGEDVTELDLSPADEQDALNGGHLEIVPRTYKVLSDNYTAGNQGDEVELTLVKEHEAALIQGGHIERVDKKPAAKAANKKKE
jgi:F0F1-type ATP synthase epsilon subunit